MSSRALQIMQIPELILRMGIKILSSCVLPEQAGFRIIIGVHLEPGKKVQKMRVLESGEIGISLKARPIEGAANSALIKFLAERFGMPPRFVHLIKGEKSRNKKLLLDFQFTPSKGVGFYLQKLEELNEQLRNGEILQGFKEQR